MNGAQIPNTEPVREFLFEAPDEIHRILLVEITRSHGLRAFVRPRSRRRVWVCGAKTKADAVAAVARRLPQDYIRGPLIGEVQEIAGRYGVPFIQPVGTTWSPRNGDGGLCVAL